MRLNKIAQAAIIKANINGLTDDSEQDIIEIVLEQEIVTYNNETDSLQIDINDIVWED